MSMRSYFPQVPLFAAATAWDDPAEKLREDDERLARTKARACLSGTQWSPVFEAASHVGHGRFEGGAANGTVYFIVTLTRPPPTLASFLPPSPTQSSLG